MSDPTRIDRPSIEQMCLVGMANAASPERIAERDRTIREAQGLEAREAHRDAVRECRRLIPLPPETHAAIAAHCDPARTSSPSLRRTDALEATAHWLRSRQRSVIALLGTVGTGKTTAAGLAAFRALARGERVVYVKEPSLLRWRKFVRHEDDMARLLRADLLILDELGTSLARDSEDARMAVLEVVDDRLSVGRTMLIGNLAKEAFGARYDARLVDRLHQVGVIAEARGPSLRRAA